MLEKIVVNPFILLLARKNKSRKFPKIVEQSCLRSEDPTFPFGEDSNCYGSYHRHPDGDEFIAFAIKPTQDKTPFFIVRSNHNPPLISIYSEFQGCQVDTIYTPDGLKHLQSTDCGPISPEDTAILQKNGMMPNYQDLPDEIDVCTTVQKFGNACVYRYQNVPTIVLKDGQQTPLVVKTND